jgi:hypothetical protein
MTDQLNECRGFTYFDPAEVLRRLRAVEREMATLEFEPEALPVVTLRTASLKPYREGRDAALFCYGMGLAIGHELRYAPIEKRDYDFVATWDQDDGRHFCQVQLKELVPAELNPSITLNALLESIAAKRLQPSQTVLAIRLNRRGQIDLKSVQLPRLPFAQLWYFWASSPDASRWCIYGDAMSQAGQWEFEYPGESA